MRYNHREWLKMKSKYWQLKPSSRSWNNPFLGFKTSTASQQQKKLLQICHTTYFTPVRFGEQEFQQFQEERLHSSPGKKKFHEPVKLKTLKTFTSLIKKKAVLTQGRAMMLKADRSLFGRMIISGQSRNIEVKTCCNTALVLRLRHCNWRQQRIFLGRYIRRYRLLNCQRNLQLADGSPRWDGSLTESGSLASSLMAMASIAAISTSFSTPIRKIPLRIPKEACEGRCLECKKWP